MRLPLGSLDVSESGGTVRLIGRRGAGWASVGDDSLSLHDALDLLDRREVDDPAGRDDAVRFAPGETILWCYRRVVETARVIRDDDDALVVWIPSGAERLDAGPADGGHVRDVALAERFSVPWVMREGAWRGPGLVRVAPRAAAWSLWFFRDADGEPAGVYVNLELPHRRIPASDDGPGTVHTHDLVLDLWVGAEHPGSEDVWLKDADELDAAVEQGRFTAAQADAVRALADHVGRSVLEPWASPLGEGWEAWRPDAAMDAPLALPDCARVTRARARSGARADEG